MAKAQEQGFAHNQHQRAASKMPQAQCWAQHEIKSINLHPGESTLEERTSHFVTAVFRGSRTVHDDLDVHLARHAVVALRHEHSHLSYSTKAGSNAVFGALARIETESMIR